MSDVIDRLVAEHLNLDQLVRLLERQPSLLADPQAPNVNLLVDVLYYLTRFPDVSHHAIEDRIAARLLRTRGLQPELVAEIEAQHAVLATQGHDLLRDLESATREEIVSRELLEANIRLYAERLRHNMKVEELTLFPAAVRHLDGDDWLAIRTASLPSLRDPLFVTPVEQRFAELRSVIADESDCGCEPAGF